MAEAVAVVGVVSNIIQIVDCTAKVVGSSSELLRNGRTVLTENADVEALATTYASSGKELAEALTRQANFMRDNEQFQDGWNSKAEYDAAQLGFRCEAKAQELIRLLEDFKLDSSATGARKLVGAVGVSAKALRKRGKIESLRKALHELNSQLSTSLLRLLLSQQCSLNSGFDGSLYPYHPDPSHSENQRLVLLLAARRRIDNILNSLKFPDMTSRQDAIGDNYSTTYDWALKLDSSGFRPWLIGSNGIFWVTGKPGSGKSTLMKYLANAPGTNELLRQWAGSQRLLTASFYFWWVGSKIQKSIEGLLRSILYQILYENPELASYAFPTEYSRAKEQLSFSWKQKELQDALKAAVLSPLMQSSGVKLCLFIDGLDEYHGFELDLIRVLDDIAKSPSIKLCVSSRPYNAFRTAYATSVPSLRMEDLTRGDLQHYVQSHIQLYQPPETRSTDSALLVNEIVTKAEGVFLWVILVVRAVIQGFCEGEHTSTLLHRVQDFPPDLHDFFQDMLKRTHYSYAKRTNQALKLAWLFVHMGDVGHRVTHAYDYWLMSLTHQGLMDDDFAFEGSLGHHPRRGSVADAEKLEETTRFISAATKGLLWVNNNKVEFLHRTVYDFLNTGEMQQSLDKTVPKTFQDGRIFHLLNLARLKHIRKIDVTDTGRWTATIASSICTTHLDHNLRYIEHFHSILFEIYLPARSQSILYRLRSSGAVAVFAAFGLSGFVLECFSFMSPAYNPLDKASVDVLTAILGRNALHSFPMKDCNVNFFRDVLLRVKLVTSYEWGSMSHDLINLILADWCGGIALSGHYCAGIEGACDFTLHGSDRYRWELLLALIESPTAIDGFDAINQALSGAELHFVSNHVPHQWLLEKLAPSRKEDTKRLGEHSS